MKKIFDNFNAWLQQSTLGELIFPIIGWLAVILLGLIPWFIYISNAKFRDGAHEWMCITPIISVSLFVIGIVGFGFYNTLKK